MQIPPIPSFLDRTNPSHPLHKQKVVEHIEKTSNVNIPLKKQTSLTNKFRQVIAGNVVKCILKGHDTFGKLRKVLNNHILSTNRVVCIAYYCAIVSISNSHDYTFTALYLLPSATTKYVSTLTSSFLPALTFL